MLQCSPSYDTDCQSAQIILRAVNGHEITGDATGDVLDRIPELAESAAEPAALMLDDLYPDTTDTATYSDFADSSAQDFSMEATRLEVENAQG